MILFTSQISFLYQQYIWIYFKPKLSHKNSQFQTPRFGLYRDFLTKCAFFRTFSPLSRQNFASRAKTLPLRLMREIHLKNCQKNFLVYINHKSCFLDGLDAAFLFLSLENCSKIAIYESNHPQNQLLRFI